MKAIAWDDEPQDYLADLVVSLRDTCNIELVVESDVESFIRRVELENDWDFVISDLLNKTPKVRGKPEADAVQICNRLAARYPVFLLTNAPERAFALPIPGSVIIKSKDVPPRWMAQELRDHLRNLGIPSCRRVFLSYGHDPRCLQTVENKLKNLKVPEVVKIDPAKVPPDILSNVLREMRDCAAIIALYTPDDEHKSGEFSARPNVVLEMGMALSLPRGPERLIILHQEGPQSAPILSNLGGQLVLNYQNDVSETFVNLEKRLRSLRVCMG